MRGYRVSQLSDALAAWQQRCGVEARHPHKKRLDGRGPVRHSCRRLRLDYVIIPHTILMSTPSPRTDRVSEKRKLDERIGTSAWTSSLSDFRIGPSSTELDAQYHNDRRMAVTCLELHRSSWRDLPCVLHDMIAQLML